MRLIEIYKEFEIAIEFCCIYIKEAHPVDGWVLPENTAESIEVNSPKSAIDRAKIAGVCMRRYSFPFRMVIDNLTDEVEELYKSEPDRLYVVGADGSVKWKSGLGPFYFDVDGWYNALRAEI